MSYGNMMVFRIFNYRLESIKTFSLSEEFPMDNFRVIFFLVNNKDFLLEKSALKYSLSGTNNDVNIYNKICLIKQKGLPPLYYRNRNVTTKLIAISDKRNPEELSGSLRSTNRT